MRCKHLFLRLASLVFFSRVVGEILVSPPAPFPAIEEKVVDGELDQFGSSSGNAAGGGASVINNSTGVNESADVPSFVQLGTSNVVYARGTGSIYWMAGMTSADYPWNCKCDAAAFSEWTANEASRTYGGSSDVLCADQTSQSLLGSSKAYCDAMNGAPILVNAVLRSPPSLLFALLSIILIF